MKRVHMESRKGNRGRKWFPNGGVRAFPSAADIGILLRVLMMGRGRR